MKEKTNELFIKKEMNFWRLLGKKININSLYIKKYRENFFYEPFENGVKKGHLTLAETGFVYVLKRSK